MYEWFTSFHYVYYKNNVYRVTSEISWVFREWNKRSDILLLLIACYSVAGWFTSKSLACRWLTHGTEVPCRSVKFELLLWTVDSRYAILGAMRGVAQTISYEVVFRGVILCPLLFIRTFDLLEIRTLKLLTVIFCLEVLLAWLVVLF